MNDPKTASTESTSDTVTQRQSPNSAKDTMSTPPSAPSTVSIEHHNANELFPVTNESAAKIEQASAQAEPDTASDPLLAWHSDFVKPWLQIQETFNQGFLQLWQDSVNQSLAPLKDKRFSHAAWQQWPHLNYLAHLYDLSASTLREMAKQSPLPEELKQKIEFALEQWLAAIAPSNYFALNAEALSQCLESHGASLQMGNLNLWHDLQQGRISMSDESAFEVGHNLATTPGKIVYRNRLFELIQYTPQQANTYRIPLLMVPPCINKFYILDLQAHNSLVAYALQQGFTVFMMSWRNPMPEDQDGIQEARWDDYIDQGVLQAAKVVRDITQTPQINALGFCVGGTLLATAAAITAARQEPLFKSLSLLTTFVDFSDTGIIDVFVDEAFVSQKEAEIGQSGLFPARDLMNTFSFIRPSELVWSYVSNNYLLGKSPLPFDLLYWNCDSTNIAGPFYCWYLRHTYLENKLIKPGVTAVNGTPLDFSKIQLPVFYYSSIKDHIVPWHTAFKSAQYLGSQVSFVLGASGHVAGVINPPSKNKRHYWSIPGHLLTPSDSAEEWLKNSQQTPGSWWPAWSTWLSQYAGERAAAHPTAGNQQYPVLDDAPGDYVKVRAIE